MSFLTPWFLAGVALIAGPIIAHLIRRATRERVVFTAIRFLDTSAPRLDRRSRIQHPWLLLLRCLIVAVLAFGFARPFFRENLPPLAVTTIPRHVVAVLDESASMQRAGSWDAAKSRILSLVSELNPTDVLALLAAGDRVTELISAAQWLSTPPENRAALVRSVLDSRQPGWGPTPLDSAAEAALARWEDMTETTGANAARRELVLVSDFATGSRIAGLANLAWPANAEVVLRQITPSVLGNANLHWLGWSDLDPERPAARIRASRTFDAPENLRLVWRDPATETALADPEPLTLLPGASEILLLPLPSNAPPALRLDLEGDQQPFDNQLFLLRSIPRELPLVYLADHAATDPQHARFYLDRAITGWRDPVPILTNALPANHTPSLIIIPDVLDSARLAEVRSRLESGSFALVLLSRDELLSTPATLAGESNWTALAQARPDALLGQLDFQHPLFAPFADPLYSDFTRIRFWDTHSVSLPANTRATVIARFDDESPAVLEVPVGRGRLIVWASGWSPSASQWVLSSKFVPWLQALAERAAGGPAQPAIAEIGSASPTPLPSTPGIHDLATMPPRRIALNVPAAESQTEPLPFDTWEQLGVPLRGATATGPAAPPSPSLTAATTESQQQLWRWILWLAVALLAFESLASLRLSRRPAPAR